MFGELGEDERSVRLHFGALVDSIADQLVAQGLSVDEDLLGHYQRDADAITRLKLRGFLTESQSAMARQKLCNTIAKSATRAK